MTFKWMSGLVVNMHSHQLDEIKFDTQMKKVKRIGMTLCGSLFQTRL